MWEVLNLWFAFSCFVKLNFYFRIKSSRCAVGFYMVFKVYLRVVLRILFIILSIRGDFFIERFIFG